MALCSSRSRCKAALACEEQRNLAQCANELGIDQVLNPSGSESPGLRVMMPVTMTVTWPSTAAGGSPAARPRRLRPGGAAKLRVRVSGSVCPVGAGPGPLAGATGRRPTAMPVPVTAAPAAAGGCARGPPGPGPAGRCARAASGYPIPGPPRRRRGSDTGRAACPKISDPSQHYI